MEDADNITLERVVTEIKISFAKMTLEMIENIRTADIRSINPETVRTARECAQALPYLITHL